MEAGCGVATASVWFRIELLMISFDLRCKKGHVFEGWFSSGARFDADAKAKRIECPICGDKRIEKAPMAPNVAAGRGEERAPALPVSAPAPLPSGGPTPAQMAEMYKAMRKFQTMVEKNFDHVGDRFAEEARKIHHGEVDKRAIYGNATPDESKALKDEGIEFGEIPRLPRLNG